MSQEIDRQEMTIRYLLGTLSEEEKTRLEEQYFVDDTEFEQLEIAEDELIDRYVRTELSPDDARRFEKLLISPRLSERVEVARMIAQRTAPPSLKQEVINTPVIAPVEPRRRSWWQNLFGPTAVASPAFRPAMACGLIFMMLTTVALFFVWMKLRTESQRLAQEQQQRQELAGKIDEQTARYGKLEEELNQTRRQKEEQQQLAEEYKQRLAQEQQRTQQGFTFPFFLNPGGGTRSTGGESVQSLTVPRGAAAVSLTLNVTDGDGDYGRYNVIVRNIDTGKEVSRPNLRPSERQGRKYIAFKLDAKLLPPGSYNVHVDGVDPTGQVVNFEDYPFRVRPGSR